MQRRKLEPNLECAVARRGAVGFRYTSPVRVYLDLCCLKRPFDLQEQPIIRIQTEAVLGILALPSDTVELLQSPALALENSLNPNHARREAVAHWLSEVVAVVPDESALSASRSRRRSCSVH
jgi:hypothetical protein